MRVDLLVPEAAVRGARLGRQLRAQRVERLAIALLVGGVPGVGQQREQHLAHVHVVEDVAVAARSLLDDAAVADQPVDVRLDVVEVAAVAGPPPDALEPGQHQADVVVPAVGQHRAALHDRVADPPRPVERGRPGARRGGAADCDGRPPHAWAAAGAVEQKTQGGERRSAAWSRALSVSDRAVTARQIDRGAATGVRTAKIRPQNPFRPMSLRVWVRTPTGARGPAIRLGLARRAANKKTRIPMTKRIRPFVQIARRDGAAGVFMSPGLRRRQRRHDRDRRHRHGRHGGTAAPPGRLAAAARPASAEPPAPAAATGTGGAAPSASPPASSTVIKGGACTPTDQQFCYKTCGPEKTGVKTETCTTAGTYAEMSGCSFDPSQGFLLLQDPDRGQHGVPRGRDAPGLDGLRRPALHALQQPRRRRRRSATSTRAARPRSAGAPARSRTRTGCARGPARATRPGRARWAPAASGRTTDELKTQLTSSLRHTHEATTIVVLQPAGDRLGRLAASCCSAAHNNDDIAAWQLRVRRRGPAADRGRAGGPALRRGGRGRRSAAAGALRGRRARLAAADPPDGRASSRRAG